MACLQKFWVVIKATISSIAATKLLDLSAQTKCSGGTFAIEATIA